MPGFNQRGPMNEGPMTGRGMGRCAAPAQDTARDWDVPGYGRGRAMGRRRCQQNRLNVDMAGGRQAFRQPEQAGEEALTRRARQLEQELEAIKNQLQVRGQE